jgi:hypothetical protein
MHVSPLDGGERKMEREARRMGQEERGITKGGKEQRAGRRKEGRKEGQDKT